MPIKGVNSRCHMTFLFSLQRLINFHATDSNELLDVLGNEIIRIHHKICSSM